VSGSYVFELVLQLDEFLLADLLGVVGGGVLPLQLVDDVRLDVLDVESLVVVGCLHVRRELTECAHRAPATNTRRDLLLTSAPNFGLESLLIKIG